MATNSRHRTNVATIFDVFCEVGIVGGVPVMLQKYPEDYCDEATLKSVAQFSFPCKITDDGVDAVQLFSFVLTDSQSQYTFGYCRFVPRNNTCIVILSGFPWHALFYKLLNHISLVMNNGSQAELDGLLTRVYHTDIPQAGETLKVATLDNTHCLDIIVPDINSLPTLREDKFMLEFYNAVTPAQMVALYASLLKERRIIFTGRKLSQLSSCVHAAASLLYPMHWQNLFIPVLPEALRDMLHAPMPFIIGVPKQVVDAQEIRDLGDVMVVDLDTKTLRGAHDDTAELPPDILSLLRSQLKTGPGMGDGLSRAFLRINVCLFGRYRMGFVRNESTGVITWDREKFILEQRQSYQAFLKSLVGTDGVQYLERFIEERIRALNLGLPINDEFEKEATALDIKYKSQVKENANDVIGVIKDKMTSIQLKDKLGRLTPKEIRKHSTRKVPFKKMPKQEAQGIEPLSFENFQWGEEAYESCEESRGASPVPGISKTAAEETANIDLIDWSSEPLDPLADLDPTSSASPSELSSTLLDRPVPTPRRSIASSVQPLAPATAAPTPPSRRPPVPSSAPVVQSSHSQAPRYAAPIYPVAATPVVLKPTSQDAMFVNPFYSNRSNHVGGSNTTWEKFE